MVANAWHQDQVIEAPEGAEVIAQSPFCANAGFVLGDRIMTIQPHPEFSGELIAALLTHRAQGVVPEDLIEAARAQVGEDTDRLALLDDIADFLRKGAA